MTGRTLICVDCAREWTWTGRRIRKDIRCPQCRQLHAMRLEVQDHLEQLVTTDRGGRLAQVAMAAAHQADSMRPGIAGPGTLSTAIHQLARSKAADEHTVQLRLVRVAAAALLWASESTGATDG